MFPLQAQRQKLQCHQYYIPWALPDGDDLQICQLPSSTDTLITRRRLANFWSPRSQLCYGLKLQVVAKPLVTSAFSQFQLCPSAQRPTQQPNRKYWVACTYSGFPYCPPYGIRWTVDGKTEKPEFRVKSPYRTSSLDAIWLPHRSRCLRFALSPQEKKCPAI